MSNEPYDEDTIEGMEATISHQQSQIQRLESELKWANESIAALRNTVDRLYKELDYFTEESQK